jgi:hypothetical protein
MQGMANTKWAQLPALARAGIVAAGVLEVGLLAAAQIDITRRSADRIRGGKMRWRLLSLVNVIGPLLYFYKGRIGAADTVTTTVADEAE